MIDMDAFYRALGASHSLGADEQLMLEGQVRVMCTHDAVTAVFEGLTTGEDKLDALFEICRLQGGMLPFTTRSGQMALRLSSQSAVDETAGALQRLRAVMAHFGLTPADSEA
jgi:hypothetical protein